MLQMIARAGPAGAAASNRQRSQSGSPRMIEEVLVGEFA